MTDKKDEIGKGPSRSGEGTRRPYATIDLRATEVGGRDNSATSAAAGGRSDARAAALPPPPGPKEETRAQSRLADGLAAARTWSRRTAQSNTFLSHVAAGVAGAVLTLAAAGLLGVFAGDRNGLLSPELSKRFANVERALDQRAAALSEDIGAKLAAAEARVASLEGRAQALAVLSSAQGKLATDVKALEARVSAPGLTERIGKLESALAALSAEDKSGRVTLAQSLAAKLAELEKLAAEAGEAVKSSSVRFDRDLAVLRSEAAVLGRRFETLKGDIEERFKAVAKGSELSPVLARLAQFEHDLQAFLKSEGERITSAQRVLLTLEIGNLKRAMDRGDGYAKELEAIKKAAGDTLNLVPLDRYSLTGAPAMANLSKDFRRVARAAADAEGESADASVLDRLLAGARSIVRFRKADHSPDDTSAEAVIGRMENALKDGNIGEVLAQGRKLPPKAALAAEDWLRKLEARHAVDRAVADIEAALKSSFAAQRLPATEPKR